MTSYIRKARRDDIEAGLRALTDEIERLGIRSIAVPALGCGLGGLDWETVLGLIKSVKLAAEQAERLNGYEAELSSRHPDQVEVERAMQPLRTFHMGLVEEIEYYESEQRKGSK